LHSSFHIIGVIGLIDGTRVGIRRPKLDGEVYFDRKKRYSLALQAVVNADKMFLDLFCGEPGSLHDGRIFRRSSLYHRAYQNTASLFPNNSFLIGDSAYPSLSWLVKPFKDYGTLTDQQKSFNFIVASTRTIVEHSFGLLKTRFRRLMHFTEHLCLNLVVNLILSACVLHNICLIQGDTYDAPLVNDDEDEESGGDEDYSYEDIDDNRRDVLFQELIQRNVI
jgi:DDE superfamily endonuclease